MKAMTCEICGSTDLVKEEGVFVCKACGTKYSVEEAKKLLKEVEGEVISKVKVDTSDELKNLYEIARRAKETENNENAWKYYDMILMKDPSSWEANYYVVYCKSMACKIAEINLAANHMVNCQEPIMKLIKENVLNEVEQAAAVEEVLMRNTAISRMLSTAAKSHYEGIDVSIQQQFVQEYCNNAAAAAQIMYTFGDVVESVFEGQYPVVSTSAWECGINLHNEYVKYLKDKEANAQIIHSYGDKIRKYNADYEDPYVNTTAGCYVATAVYGSYDCPEVWTLRRYRDFTLDETWYGRLFIKWYYATSPTFVKYFGQARLFKSIGKSMLDRWVSTLNRKGIADTPYKDKY